MLTTLFIIHYTSTTIMSIIKIFKIIPVPKTCNRYGVPEVKLNTFYTQEINGINQAASSSSFLTP